jgi:hypothetical protein
VLSPEQIRGVVELIAEARDTPQLSVPPPFAGHPVTPALVCWRDYRLQLEAADTRGKLTRAVVPFTLENS